MADPVGVEVVRGLLAGSAPESVVTQFLAEASGAVRAHGTIVGRTASGTSHDDMLAMYAKWRRDQFEAELFGSLAELRSFLSTRP